MSVSDSEVIREMLEATNRGDYEAAIELLHDEAELHQAPEQPGGGSYYGKQEFARGAAEWLSEFEPGFQYVIEELVDAGGCLLACVRLRGRGAKSGIEVEMEVFHVYEVRDGKAFRCRVFLNESDAREAAGLRGT